ncbi:MAG: group III truncated hemoglobin [Flavobacteriaceae bacterium]|nr:group III truncated hemoglobin [Flavobacteriaceae bacterium]
MSFIVKTIDNKEDVAFLVDQFYAQVREEASLGPIFNAMIGDWDRHLELLTRFWSMHLMFERNYTGNPIEIHRKVDRFVEGTINEQHFGLWLNLWMQTIDTHFEGENAEILKNKARKMASFIHIDIFTHRKGI